MKKKRAPRKMSPEAEKRRDDMRAKYRGGMSLKAIGWLYGLTRERARQIIALGISARPPRPPRPVPPKKPDRRYKSTPFMAQMEEMRKRGCTINAIAEATGLGKKTVRKHVRRMGLGGHQGWRKRAQQH